MLILSLLIGCKSDQSLTAEPELEDTVPDGTLVLEIPEAISWSEAGALEVSGQAENMESLTLNEVPLTITDGTFSETIILERGINHLVASGVDIGGDPLTDEATVLAGTFATPGNTMPSVLSAHLSPRISPRIGISTRISC